MTSAFDDVPPIRRDPREPDAVHEPEAPGPEDAPRFVAASAAQAPHEAGAEEREEREGAPGGAASGSDTTAWIGAAVVLASAAGIALLLACHFLLGWLWLAGALLAGSAAASGLLAVGPLRRRLRPLTARTLAAGLALAVSAAVALPPLAAARPEPLAQLAALSIAPLGERDQVISPSAPPEDADPAQVPVLVRRADGSGQLLQGEHVAPVPAERPDLLALSSDGSRLVRADASGIRTTSAGGAWRRWTAPVPGAPVAVAGDVLVARACSEGLCRLSGHDLSRPDAPELWSIIDGTAQSGADARGAAPTGVELELADAQPGIDAAARERGLLPAAALRFDPAQGWTQLEATTGFPQGEVLVPAVDADRCRLAVTAPEPPDPQRPGLGASAEPLVLTVCAGEDGALTATAFAQGARLWTSDPSPAGQWRIRMDHGRVIAAGTEEGAQAEGELVASSAQAAWGAPGGELFAQAEPMRVRIGIDGAVMLGANTAGQAVLYDTATGVDRGSLPLSGREAGVRGDLGAGSAVVIDPAPRERPLDPRGAERLRILDPAGHGVVLRAVVPEGSRALAVGRDAALVSGPDGAHLLRAPAAR